MAISSEGNVTGLHGTIIATLVKRLVWNEMAGEKSLLLSGHCKASFGGCHPGGLTV